jgi:hypothetical protein
VKPRRHAALTFLLAAALLALAALALRPGPASASAMLIPRAELRDAQGNLVAAFTAPAR